MTLEEAVSPNLESYCLILLAEFVFFCYMIPASSLIFPVTSLLFSLLFLLCIFFLFFLAFIWKASSALCIWCCSCSCSLLMWYCVIICDQCNGKKKAQEITDLLLSHPTFWLQGIIQSQIFHYNSLSFLKDTTEAGVILVAHLAVFFSVVKECHSKNLSCAVFRSYISI